MKYCFGHVCSMMVVIITRRFRFFQAFRHLHLPMPADQLEYNYRIGRIYDALNRKTEALAAYQVALTLGINRREYYAARAALQIGYIYESTGRQKKCTDLF